MANEVLARLLLSPEPAIRYKTLVRVCNLDPLSAEALAARQDLPASAVVKALLSEVEPDTGTITVHPYSKWRGAHWVLACLADLCYPPGDQALMPLLEQVYSWLFSPQHQKAILTIEGRVRRCASQEGNALYSSLALGLADTRSQELTERLMKWQWPDGGWNCDKRPGASHSSFMESLIPLRALILYALKSGDPAAARSAGRAAEIFLQRELFKRRQDGAVINPDFLKLHYPPYWHYDILFGLKVMAEAGLIGDPRCNAALDLLEAKRIPDGGFPAEGKYYHTVEERSGATVVDWGGTSKKKLNEFISADALFVLHSAKRC